mgnify:CR=1 FL=1
MGLVYLPPPLCFVNDELQYTENMKKKFLEPPYLSALFSLYPNIPKVYRSDDLAEFKTTGNEAVIAEVMKRSNEYVAKNNPQMVNILREEDYPGYPKVKSEFIHEGLITHNSELVLHDLNWYAKEFILIPCNLAPDPNGKDDGWNAITVATIKPEDMDVFRQMVNFRRAQEVLNIFEPGRKEHTPWAETFSEKVVDFCEREKFYAPLLAEAIKSPVPETTIQNYFKTVSAWNLARAHGTSVKGFAENGYGLTPQMEVSR